MPFFKPSLLRACGLSMAAIAFLSGVLLLQQGALLPDRHWAWSIPLFLVFIARVPVLCLPAFVALGFLWALVVAAGILASSLPVELEGVDLVVEGEIASIPQIDEDRLRFEMEPARLINDGRVVDSPGKILLRWYGDRQPHL